VRVDGVCVSNVRSGSDAEDEARKEEEGVERKWERLCYWEEAADWLLRRRPSGAGERRRRPEEVIGRSGTPASQREKKRLTSGLPGGLGSEAGKVFNVQGVSQTTAK
jgi:hypothetical protein